MYRETNEKGLASTSPNVAVLRTVATYFNLNDRLRAK
jgi:hypothetical protein